MFRMDTGRQCERMDRPRVLPHCPAFPVLDLLIRVDFVLAVVLLVAAPLGLLAAAVARPPVRAYLLAYWRASSLLMITVYLMIDGRSIAFVTGNAALVLIPLVLWYGDALAPGPRPRLDDSPIAVWIRRWRIAAAVFCGASLLLTLPVLRCAVANAGADPTCAAWFAPPRALHAALHPSIDPTVLGDAATVGLAVYGAYLLASLVMVGRHAVRG